MIAKILSAALFMSILGCRTTVNREARVFNSETCPGGDLTPFTIAGIDGAAYPLPIKFSEFPALSYKGVPPDSAKQAQINLCFRGEDDFSILSIKILQNSEVFEMKNPEIITQEGLKEALFGEVGQLDVVGKIELPEHMTGPDMFILRGFKAGDLNFVGFDLARLKNNATPVYYDTSVIAGNLAMGEGAFPNSTNECGFNQTLVEKSFKIDTAKFEMKSCEFMTMDRSVAILPIWAKLTDDNADAGGIITHTWDKPEDFKLPDGGFLYKWSHHNMFDTLDIRVEEATYTIKHANNPVGREELKYEAKYLRTDKVVSKEMRCPGIRSCP